MPRGTIAYNNLYRKILSSNPSVMLEPNSVKKTQNAVLVIGDVVDNNVSNLLMFDFDASGNQRVIASEDAVIQQPSDSQVLMQINMHNPLILIPDNADYSNIDYLSCESAVMNVFASSFGATQNFVNPQEMTCYDLKKYIENLKIEGTQSANYINIFEVEYNRKFALPFASLFFAFLAFPLAIVFGKHNGQTVGFIVGIVICLLYWTVQTLGQIFGQRNGIPVKPDPQIVYDILEATGCTKEETLYLGDTCVDMETAHRAGLKAVGVLWGYRPRTELEEAKADVIIEQPRQILSLV